jgi:hypothetical protein
MIIIPDAIWNLLIKEFQACKTRLEQVAYLEGVEVENVAVATTVTFPNAVLGRESFYVSAEAMSEAGRHLGQPQVRLAQVHTHPTHWVGHSPTDDARAYSHHDGAVSIVIPNYAASYKAQSELGVHVCTARKWHQLSPSETQTFLTFVPVFVDLRRRRKPAKQKSNPFKLIRKSL